MPPIWRCSPGADFLVIGHEGFGQVEAVGPNVSELKIGDYVVVTVLRPGKSIYDLIGTNDMTTDETYFERELICFMDTCRSIMSITLTLLSKFRKA